MSEEFHESAEELQKRVLETTGALLEGAEPERISWLATRWKYLPRYDWGVAPRPNIADIVINGVLGRHLEVRNVHFNLSFGRLYIEELATVSRSKRKVGIIKVTGTSVIESQPGYTDASSWAEKPKWSYDIVEGDLRLETSQALFDLLERIRTGGEIGDGIFDSRLIQPTHN